MNDNDKSKPFKSSSISLEMVDFKEAPRDPEAEYKPPSMNDSDKKEENPRSSEESKSDQSEGTKDDLSTVDQQIKQKYKCYPILLFLMFIFDFMMVSFYWTDFTDPVQAVGEEVGYFILLAFMMLLWIFAMFAYCCRILILQTVFVATVFVCMTLGGILIFIDLVITHRDSALDKATDPKIMLVILIIGPSIIFTRAAGLQMEFSKRKKLINYISKKNQEQEPVKEYEAPERPQQSSIIVDM